MAGDLGRNDAHVTWFKWQWRQPAVWRLKSPSSLRWRHNEHDSVSNHQPHHSLLKRLFRRRSKKTSKLRVTGHCAGNSPATGEFPAQMASYAENVSIWWRHHVLDRLFDRLFRLTKHQTSPPYWLSRGNPPIHRWIPLTKDRLCRIIFHEMSFHRVW